MNDNKMRLIVVLVLSMVLMAFHFKFLSGKHIEINFVDNKPETVSTEPPHPQPPTTIEQPSTKPSSIEQPKVEQPKIEQPKVEPQKIETPSESIDVQTLAKANQKLDMAKRLLDRNKAEETIKACNEVLKLNPKSALAYTFRGNAYQQLREYSRSIEDYDKALELEPRNALAYLNRGIANAHLYNHEQSIVDLNKSIELEPLGDVAYFNRGLEYSRLNNRKQAIADLTMAINLNPNYGAAYKSRGVCYQLSGDNQLIRLFMILLTVLMTVFLLSSVQIEFEVDADGSKRMSINFNREQSISSIRRSNSIPITCRYMLIAV